MLGNWGGQSIWWPRSILIMKTEWKKLRKNNVENVDAGECLNYTGEKMLLAILAWDIGKAGQRRMRKKLGTWIGITGFYIRRRRRRITRNIVRGKLNVKCVSVEWGNLIGQDIWWVGSICWGVGVEKLMVMWGVEEDDTKGRARLPSTLRYAQASNTNFSQSPSTWTFFSKTKPSSGSSGGLVRWRSPPASTNASNQGVSRESPLKNYGLVCQCSNSCVLA